MKAHVFTGVYRRMRATGESPEEISAEGGENTAVIFRSTVLRSRKMIVVAQTQTS
jgi:hypothetical protein